MNQQPQNYCRQLAHTLRTFLKNPSVPAVTKAKMAHVIDLCKASQKFMLPDGGTIIDDPQFRALADLPELKIPHPFVALEFSVEDLHAPHRKHVIFLREDEEFVNLSIMQNEQCNGNWLYVSECAIHKTDYIETLPTHSRFGMLKFRASDPEQNEEMYNRYLRVFLGFLNALQCSNVHIERHACAKPCKKVKNALPFDAYHVLTIDVARTGSCLSTTTGGSHRSPREHLRRGHIVRPEKQRPYWRNATVVNAGRGFAKIDKDYRLKNTARIH